MDVLEIEENINGLSFRTAQELIDISTDNIDGFAEINIGASNKITLHGKSLNTITPRHFRIIPKIDKYIYGSENNDVLIGSELNEYIKGSKDTLDRHDDGHDVLDGGSGDDVLDGGPYKRVGGGYVIDLYKFDSNYGYDRVVGFFAQDIYEGYSSGNTTYKTYEAGIKSDKIEIPLDVISSASTLINNAINNEDGFAQLSFANTIITLHSVSKEQLKPDYFFIVPRTENEIIGTDDHDILIGTDSNDRIMGSSNSFDTFDDGNDFLEGGLGDDILIGGPANASIGGNIRDRYRFGENFGNDYLISFYAEDLYPSNLSNTNPDGDGAKHSDRIEIINIYADTASDIINNSVNNDDGWAVIKAGSNSITIFGLPKEKLKPDYFHIIPEITNTITGSDGDDNLEGTNGNDYIQGSSNPLGWASDGADTLEGKEGDDVLIGGSNFRGYGGYDEDIYIFSDNSGNDLIIGFLFDQDRYSSTYNDIIQISSNINNSGITSFNDVIAATNNNKDGWAVINLGSGNSVTLHGVPKSKLISRNFRFVTSN